MYFENYVIINKPNFINSIIDYKIIMDKFINTYIKLYTISSVDDAIIYSKYYLYYKIKNCMYDYDIMKILYTVEEHC